MTYPLKLTLTFARDEKVRYRNSHNSSIPTFFCSSYGFILRKMSKLPLASLKKYLITSAPPIFPSKSILGVVNGISSSSLDEVRSLFAFKPNLHLSEFNFPDEYLIWQRVPRQILTARHLTSGRNMLLLDILFTFECLNSRYWKRGRFA